MNKYLINYIIFLILILTCIGSNVVSQDDWRNYKPVDEEEAFRVRVWLGLERAQRCRTSVVIVNSEMDTVRHLLNQLMSKGYYNYYWDKRDDSGNYVSEGDYQYLVQDCKYHKPGKLKVIYKEFEKSFDLSVENFGIDSTINLKVYDDSLPILLEVENRRSDVVYTPLKDTILNKGEHIVRWLPPKKLLPGRYSARVTVGDHVVKKEMVLKR